MLDADDFVYVSTNIDSVHYKNPFSRGIVEVLTIF